MNSVHGKAFLDTWRGLYRQTNPSLAADLWHVDGVEWSRQIHRYVGQDYAFQIETHLLTHAGPTATAWSLLVVVERWSQPGKRDVLKSSEWRQVIKGRDKQVLSWFTRQRERLERPSANSRL